MGCGHGAESGCFEQERQWPIEIRKENGVYVFGIFPGHWGIGAHIGSSVIEKMLSRAGLDFSPQPCLEGFLHFGIDEWHTAPGINYNFSVPAEGDNHVKAEQVLRQYASLVGPEKLCGFIGEELDVLEQNIEGLMQQRGALSCTLAEAKAMYHDVLLKARQNPEGVRHVRRTGYSFALMEPDEDKWYAMNLDLGLQGSERIISTALLSGKDPLIAVPLEYAMRNALAENILNSEQVIDGSVGFAMVEIPPFMGDELGFAFGAADAKEFAPWYCAAKNYADIIQGSAFKDLMRSEHQRISESIDAYLG